MSEPKMIWFMLGIHYWRWWYT